MALAVPGPNRSSWAAAQGSHYLCGVLALALLHTAVAAPTATYCTIKSVEGHSEGEGRG